MTSIRPMLAVIDLPRTIAFYKRLGFECLATFGDPPVWCTLARDGQQIMFNAPPREDVIRDVPAKSKEYQIFYINTDDAAGMRDELMAAGVTVSGLRVMIYRMKEFDVRDPDGYWLMYGQETDEPPTECDEG